MWNVMMVVDVLTSDRWVLEGGHSDEWVGRRQLIGDTYLPLGWEVFEVIVVVVNVQMTKKN